MNQPQKLPIVLRLLRKLNFPRKLGLLEKIYGSSLERHGLCWVECSNGVAWKLDLSDACHRWIVFGKYEGGNGIDFALSALKDGGVYVDSGANIGQWLLYLGHIKNLRSLAFEPVSGERAWLTKCVSAQNDWNVDIIEHGLGAQSAELSIQIDGARSTLNMDWYQGKNLSREQITIRSLANELKRLEVDTVDFWKLDTEGAELDALKGAEPYLRNKQIKHIYFECHPSNYQQIVEFLAAVDYAVLDLVGSELVPYSAAQIPNTMDLVAMPIVEQDH